GPLLPGGGRNFRVVQFTAPGSLGRLSLLRRVRSLIPRSLAARVRLPLVATSARSISTFSISSRLKLFSGRDMAGRAGAAIADGAPAAGFTSGTVTPPSGA